MLRVVGTRCSPFDLDRQRVSHRPKIVEDTAAFRVDLGFCGEGSIVRDNQMIVAATRELCHG
jgi:hypothetical protein